MRTGLTPDTTPGIVARKTETEAISAGGWIVVLLESGEPFDAQGKPQGAASVLLLPPYFPFAQVYATKADADHAAGQWGHERAEWLASVYLDAGNLMRFQELLTRREPGSICYAGTVAGCEQEVDAEHRRRLHTDPMYRSWPADPVIDAAFWRYADHFRRFNPEQPVSLLLWTNPATGEEGVIPDERCLDLAMRQADLRHAVDTRREERDGTLSPIAAETRRLRFAAGQSTMRQEAKRLREWSDSADALLYRLREETYTLFVPEFATVERLAQAATVKAQGRAPAFLADHLFRYLLLTCGDGGGTIGDSEGRRLSRAETDALPEAFKDELGARLAVACLLDGWPMVYVRAG